MSRFLDSFAILFFALKPTVEKLFSLGNCDFPQKGQGISMTLKRKSRLNLRH
jgi:hypothetical protein